MDRRQNPPWVDQAITRSWSTIHGSVAPPLVARRRTGRLHADELGCGTYGCVLPTEQPGVVMKITNDQNEARLVSLLIATREDPPGLVTYFDILRLRDKRQNRPLWAIWREEAYDIGLTHRPTSEVRLLQKRVNRITDLGEDVRSWYELVTDHWKVFKAAMSPRALERASDLVNVRAGIPEVDDVALTKAASAPSISVRVAARLLACSMTAELMRREDTGRLVGETVSAMLDQGVLLVDIHESNLGRVDRPGEYGAVVITDPGRSLFLNKRLRDRVEQLAPEKLTRKARSTNPAKVVSFGDAKARRAEQERVARLRLEGRLISTLALLGYPPPTTADMDARLLYLRQASQLLADVVTPLVDTLAPGRSTNPAKVVSFADAKARRAEQEREQRIRENAAAMQVLYQALGEALEDAGYSMRDPAVDEAVRNATVVINVGRKRGYW